MSRERQIDEMITDIGEVQSGGWRFEEDGIYTTDTHNTELATHLYDAGYRKQTEGEWIKHSQDPETMKMFHDM